MFLPVAFGLGFLGSFHCMGMCGPIALALPLNRKNYFTMVTGGVAYNLGRVFTYAVVGLVFGLIGQGLFIAGYQNLLSLILGILILLSLVFAAWANRLGNNAFLFRIVNNIKARIIPLFNKRSTGGLFLIGMLNGLLPCGFVYMAITGAIATGEAANGALFMATFGLGTLPAMLAMNMIGGFVSVNFRNKVRKMVPVVVGIMGLALVLRGLNLGIPYLSPSITEKKIEVLNESGKKEEKTIEVHDCCKKPGEKARKEKRLPLKVPQNNLPLGD